MGHWYLKGQDTSSTVMHAWWSQWIKQRSLPLTFITSLGYRPFFPLLLVQLEGRLLRGAAFLGCDKNLSLKYDWKVLTERVWHCDCLPDCLQTSKYYRISSRKHFLRSDTSSSQRHKYRRVMKRTYWVNHFQRAKWKKGELPTIYACISDWDRWQL